MQSSTTLTASGVWRGLKMALPYAASSGVYGLAFGLLANQTGLSVAESVAMSALVFSGTAQIAVLQSWASNPSLIAITLTVLIVNLRYILIGASLRPWLGQLSPLKSTAALLTIVDGSYAIGMREHAKGENDAGVLAGAGIISFTGWVVGTGLGFYMGSLVPNPKVIGLDFVVIAFCASTTALMLGTTRDFLPAAVALIAVVACEIWAPGPWSVVVAALSALLTAALRHKSPPSADAEAANA
ncbi:MAG: branched-chain amino acid ABC transporter permease [Hyphomicrobiaceae bacterium]|nr:branched-chain amino acid ABC transporter permease [Hyphomicrobiaceae bacterium]